MTKEYMTDGNRTAFSARVKTETWQDLRGLAAKMGISFNLLINEILEDYLKSKDDGRLQSKIP